MTNKVLLIFCVKLHKEKVMKPSKPMMAKKQLKSSFEDPDLILLDCMLPKIDGFDVCRNLRKETIVPIIMLTANQRK